MMKHDQTYFKLNVDSFKTIYILFHLLKHKPKPVVSKNK